MAKSVSSLVSSNSDKAVVAGPICPPGALLRVGRRLSPEGGAEVPADWAGPAVER